MRQKWRKTAVFKDLAEYFLMFHIKLFREIKVLRPDRFQKPVRSLNQNIYLNFDVGTIP